MRVSVRPRADTPLLTRCTAVSAGYTCSPLRDRETPASEERAKGLKE